MSIRNLDSLFDPIMSIVVCGASLRPGSVGATVWHNLNAGNFKGALYGVNPKHRELGWPPGALPPGRSARSFFTGPYLHPLATVAGLIAELAELGTRVAVVVMTAGMDASQKRVMQEAARLTLLRILGRDCIAPARRGCAPEVFEVAGIGRCAHARVLQLGAPWGAPSWRAWCKLTTPVKWLLWSK